MPIPADKYGQEPCTTTNGKNVYELLVLYRQL